MMMLPQTRLAPPWLKHAAVLAVAAGALALTPNPSFAAAKTTTKAAPTATSASQAPRQISIDMQAIAFKPTSIRVGERQTVTLRFVNNTNVVHEAFIGSIDEQLKHHKAMKAMAADGVTPSHAAGEKGFVLVPAHTTKNLTYTFGRIGRVLIGCHQPGHWESGMKMIVNIVPPKSL